MADSSRAAELARECGIDVGLHLNFSEPLTGEWVGDSVRRDHERVRSFLRKSKYALLVYNPFLRASFRNLFRAQWEEFIRLYGRRPSRIDGHQHLHLCSNVLADRLIPRGTRVRRSFSFEAGERNYFNVRYRRIVDRVLSHRYLLTDYFFALSQNLAINSLRRVVNVSSSCAVELMCHPEVNREYDLIKSTAYIELVRGHASLC